MITSATAMQLAQSVLTIEAQALQTLAKNLDENFYQIIHHILHWQGRIAVSGMGKSGHIARKIAATLSSTGTPAFFMHPAEASHGDLGMLTKDDIVLMLSNSGETHELLAILPVIKRMGLKLFAMTGNASSTLAQLSDHHLYIPIEKEACPLNLAPTASTTAMLALGDALAIVLLDARGFGEEDFAQSHPGGALGRRLLTYVRDVMRTGKKIPSVSSEASFTEALLEMTSKQMGMTAVLDDDKKVIGIFTDGDLRRLLEKTLNLETLKLVDVMSKNPHTIGQDHLAVEAAALMEQHHITQLLVTNAEGHLEGALNVHDLFVAKVV